MKVLLLEPDKKLAKRIAKYLCSTRLKFHIKIIHEEKDIYNHLSFLVEAAIFVLNLKDPKDTKIMDFIREENSQNAPILLILEKNVNPKLLKTIYYLSYDDVIVKNFIPEELAFHVYKLCDIWNENIFFLAKDTFFDFKNSIFCFQEKIIHLGKKEALMLKLLFIKSPSYVTFDQISYYVYQDEMTTQERVRSLIRELRKKIPIKLILTLKGEGYYIPKL